MQMDKGSTLQTDFKRVHTAMNRRKAIRIVSMSSLLSPVAFLAACGRQSNIDAAIDKVADASPVIEPLALVGVLIGERLVKLPQPALRIVGIVLIVGSEVMMDFVNYAKQYQRFRLEISMSESQQLQKSGKLVFLRQNGTTEEHRIGSEDFSKQLSMRFSESLRA
jgi:hypothetical protein